MAWSQDTGQHIPCFDSCQLTKTWISDIKDVPMVMNFLDQSGLQIKIIFLRYGAPLVCLWHAGAPLI